MTAVGFANVHVAEELLREAIHAPATARIVDVEMNRVNGTVRILFTSPDLPCEYPVPTLDPTITKTAESEYVWEWNL